MSQARSHTAAPSTLDRELRRDHLRWMLRARLLEERLRSLYRQGLVPGGVYLGIGQEALSAAAGLSLRQGDRFAPAIRDMAGRLAYGESIADALRVYLGKRTGVMKGRDGNIHRGDLARGELPMISHLGAMIPTVAGMLLAQRLRDGADSSVGLTSIGDGAMNCGATHEGINAAAVHRLPMVFVVANNGYSYSTPNRESFACADLVDRAVGYGIAGHRCDATDPTESLETVHAAVAAARAGGGPQLVVGRLLRLCGHGEHDDASYVDPAAREAARDCLAVAEVQGREEGLIDDGEWARWREAIAAEIDAALEEVEAEADPDPAEETWRAYADRWPGLEEGP